RRLCPILGVAAIAFVALTLVACNAQPAIVDAPTPIPSATLASAPVPQQVQDKDATPTPFSGQPGAEPTLGPYSFTDAHGVPFPVPSTEANVINTTDMQTAWGANLSVRTIPSNIDADHVFLLRAVDEEGRYLVGQIITRSLNLSPS